MAAHYDFVDVAILLLVKGASPHATAKNGYTPLHIAAKKKQIEIATTLLEYGADTNAESKAGFTPLHLAAQEGHTDMGELLISHKANVNAKSKVLITFYFTIFYNCHLNINHSCFTNSLINLIQCVFFSNSIYRYFQLAET